MCKLIEDWNKLIADKISTEEFVRNNWESFLGVYVATLRKKDISDLYLRLYEVTSKMVKLDVVPVFNHPAKLIKYFKNYLINSKINEGRKLKLNEISLDSLNEDYDFELMGDADIETNETELNDILCEIEKRVSPLQMTSIVMLLKGYTRKEISELLGIKLHTINDRIYRTKEVIQTLLKNQY